MGINYWKSKLVYPGRKMSHPRASCFALVESKTNISHLSTSKIRCSSLPNDVHLVYMRLNRSQWNWAYFETRLDYCLS